MDPPYIHRLNVADQSIRNCKNHFISGISTTNTDFPISPVSPKFLITLNLLRNYRVKPTLSTYAYLFGLNDFNKSPMAPPGTCMIVHNKPVNIISWENHGKIG